MRKVELDSMAYPSTIILIKIAATKLILNSPL